MSRKKFTNVTNQDGLQIIPYEFPVAAGAIGTIEDGMMAAIASNAAAEAANGATAFSGIAANLSTDTMAAAGIVRLFRSPVLRFEGFAQTPGNLSGSTLLTLVTLDVSGTDHLIDENDVTNGFIRIIAQNIRGIAGLCLCEADLTV